ncbi:MAG: DUF3617 family protein [Comamonas sp.]
MTFPSALSLAAAVSTAVLLGACSSTATRTAEDLPRPQSGQWQITSTDQSGESVTFRDCMDRDTFYKTRELIQAKREVQQCTTNTVQNSPNNWTYASNCQVGSTPQRIQSERQISGDFINRFTVESVTKQQMPDNTIVQTSRTIKGSYLGACPVGIQPGDRVFEDGKRINFYDITGIAPK